MLKWWQKRALKKAIEEVQKCGMMKGVYDAKNGNNDFMWGIEFALLGFAYQISDHYGELIEDEFDKNMIESRERAGKYEG